MGLDGFSMGNLGLHKELTSAQMSNQAEQLALRGSEFQIKSIDELSKEKSIERKKESKEEKKEREEIQDVFEQIDEDLEEGENDDDEEEEIVKQKNEPSKGFSVKMNKETEMIELYDNKDNRIVQTITAQELISLILKLNSASGIFVNRKI